MQWPDLPSVDDGWLRGDLHVHTNYSDDALEQQGDWLAPSIDIADACRAPAWVAFNPGSEDDHLHFVAITDHRTTAPTIDPDFTDPYVVLLGGEEFGSDGHAGVFGSRDHVTEQPVPGQMSNRRMQQAIDEVHAQGAAFSINHPTRDGDLWTWDVHGFDGIEVWNGLWSMASADVTEERLNEVVAATGVEGPAVRVAVRAQGGGENAQALRFWQAYLSV